MTPVSETPSRSASLAALLSFLMPGLGQIYTHRWLAALIFAAPPLALVALIVTEARRGPILLIGRLLDPTIAYAAVVVVVALGVWRVFSIWHAYRAAGPRIHISDRLAVMALLAAVVAMHSLGSAYLWSAAVLDQDIFGVKPGDVEAAEDPTGSRVTILLAGLDQYVTRSERLYDSLMVVSVDKATNRIAMVSVPRDTANYPLYYGGTGKPKINSIPTYVRNGWLKSPDEPVTTLVKEVGFLVGIKINYYAVLDLATFMKLIDAVGGLDIDAQAVNDPTYDWLDGSPYGFSIAAGQRHLDGRHALAYVRSRHGAGNSDWARAARQQQVLGAMVKKMSSPSTYLMLPNLLGQAQGVVKTNYPASSVADMIDYVKSVPADNYDRYVLGPPYTVSTATSGASTSCLKLDKVAPLSIKLFGQDSRYYGKTQAATC
jgi:polyisoprenyl-teichoic acid--peptidoglycan teichoic acid transferase